MTKENFCSNENNIILFGHILEIIPRINDGRMWTELLIYMYKNAHGLYITDGQRQKSTTK